MPTLEDPATRSLCLDRIARLDPRTLPKWGRMTAPQMICHLNDSFHVALGEKQVSPANNLFTRTVMKFFALHTPLVWPPGVATRPEIEQGRGGTTPANWDEDCAELRASLQAFANGTAFGTHAIFGKLSRNQWMIWGYRHVDHHLRQFNV